MLYDPTQVLHPLQVRAQCTHEEIEATQIEEEEEEEEDLERPKTPTTVTEL